MALRKKARLPAVKPSLESRLAELLAPGSDWHAESLEEDRRHRLKQAGLGHILKQEERQARWLQAYRALGNRTDFVGLVSVHREITSSERQKLVGEIASSHLDGPSMLLAVASIRGIGTYVRDRSVQLGSARKSVVNSLTHTVDQDGVNVIDAKIEDFYSGLTKKLDIVDLADVALSSEQLANARYPDHVVSNLFVVSPTEAEIFGASPNPEDHARLQILGAMGPQYGNITWKVSES